MNFCNLLLLTLFVSVGKSQSSLPVLTLQTDCNYVIYIDGNMGARLSCNATGATSSITWKRNNRNYSTVDMMTIYAHKGNYTCVASNDVGISSSNTVVLIGAHLPTSYFQFFSRDLKSPHIVRVTEGQSTSVDCGRWTTGIYELTSLVWKIRFGSQFRSLAPHDRVYVGRNSSLLLLQPRNATYSCSLQYYQVRPAVTFSGYIRIIVEESTASPTLNFLVRPQDISVKQGAHSSFKCVPGGGGNTTQSVRWTHPNITNFGTSPPGLNYKFTIRDVTTENIGSYSCTIVGTTLTSTARLTIIEPPSITSGLSPLNLTYGDPLLFSCSASSTHPVRWEWFHNGSRVLDEMGPTLAVASVVIGDAGSYQCIVYNSAGHAQSAAVVQVNYSAATSLKSSSLSSTISIAIMIFASRVLGSSSIHSGL